MLFKCTQCYCYFLVTEPIHLILCHLFLKHQRERHFYGPKDRIRPSKKKGKGGDNVTLRFVPGDRVECAIDQEWLPGHVVRLWYREENFEEGYSVPYQVRLDRGE